MKVLVAVMPIAGHVAPVTGLVAELIGRGHAVQVYTGARYSRRFADLGAEVSAWSPEIDFNDDDLADAAEGRFGVVRSTRLVKKLFLDTGAGQVQDLTRLLDRAPADVVVADILSIGAGLISELRGLPWAGLGLLAYNSTSRELPPPGFRVAPARGRLGRVRDRALWAAYRGVTSPFQRAYNEVRTDLGLPRDREPYGVSLVSPWLMLATGGPALQQSPTAPPDHMHFIGRLTPARSADFGPPPSRRGGRPRVLVTQGTHNRNPADLLQPALLGLADLEVEVVATTGRRGVTDVGIEVPANARVVDLLDFRAALSDTTILVTNGGWGGVLEGLSAGVPLVVAGGDIDKPENAARVARSGAGINLRTGHPRPAAIAKAIVQLLDDPSYARRAGELGAELDQLGGAGTAVDLIEDLDRTWETVPRG